MKKPLQRLNMSSNQRGGMFSLRKLQTKLIANLQLNDFRCILHLITVSGFLKIALSLNFLHSNRALVKSNSSRFGPPIFILISLSQVVGTRQFLKGVATRFFFS